jgi:ComF family protein
VHALKYEQRPELGALLAEEMLEALGNQWAEDDAADPVDAVTALPLHPAREAARGYNQALLLAKPVAAAWSLPVMEDAVKRVRDTRSQLGLDGQARRENVHEAFQAEATRVFGKNILLVDDVRTTGSTLEACSTALLEAGAASVHALTLAQTI